MKKIIIGIITFLMLSIVIISLIKDYNEKDNILKRIIENPETSTSMNNKESTNQNKEGKDAKSMALDTAKRVDSNTTMWQGFEITINKIQISKKIPDYPHVMTIEAARVKDGIITNDYSCVTLSMTVVHREMVDDWKFIYLNGPDIVSFDENDSILDISEEIGTNNMKVDSKSLYQLILGVGKKKQVDVSYWVKDACIRDNNSVYYVDYGGVNGYNMELKTYLPLNFKEEKRN